MNLKESVWRRALASIGVFGFEFFFPWYLTFLKDDLVLMLYCADFLD